MPTWENADALGPRRAARRHCLEGATKARAEIIAKSRISQDQQASVVSSEPRELYGDEGEGRGRG
jgi:hypothetical protein